LLEAGWEEGPGGARGRPVFSGKEPLILSFLGVKSRLRTGEQRPSQGQDPPQPFASSGGPQGWLDYAPSIQCCPHCATELVFLIRVNGL
jgi:hypothetical protein